LAAHPRRHSKRNAQQQRQILKGKTMARPNKPESANPWAPDADPVIKSKAPLAGQSRPYNSGDNAAGVHQTKARHNATAGDAAASQPSQNAGWNARSPSKKY